MKKPREACTYPWGNFSVQWTTAFPIIMCERHETMVFLRYILVGWIFGECVGWTEGWPLINKNIYINCIGKCSKIKQSTWRFGWAWIFRWSWSRLISWMTSRFSSWLWSWNWGWLSRRSTEWLFRWLCRGPNRRTSKRLFGWLRRGY